MSIGFDGAVPYEVFGDVFLQHEVEYAEQNTRETSRGLSEELSLREKRHFPMENGSNWYVEVHPKEVACIRESVEGLIEKKQVFTKL